MLTAPIDEEATAFGAIDRNRAQELVRQLLEQAIAIGQAHGLRVTTRGCRWDEGSCCVRIDFYNALSPMAPPRERIAHRRWLTECRAYELSRHHLGRSFTVDGETYDVLGLEVVHEVRFVLARRAGADPTDPAAFRLFPVKIAAHALNATNIERRIAAKTRKQRKQ